MGHPFFCLSILLMKRSLNNSGNLKYIHECFDMPPFKKYSLFPFPLNVGYT